MTFNPFAPLLSKFQTSSRTFWMIWLHSQKNLGKSQKVTRLFSKMFSATFLSSLELISQRISRFLLRNPRKLKKSKIGTSFSKRISQRKWSILKNYNYFLLKKTDKLTKSSLKDFAKFLWPILSTCIQKDQNFWKQLSTKFASWLKAKFDWSVLDSR